MRAHEIFRGLSAERVGEILGYIREQQREVYRTTLAALAAQLRLRPLFVQKKPAAQQAAWMGKTLALRSSDETAEQLLQVWLLKAKRDLLVMFLDGMGIAHDGEGAVDDLPESLDGDKLGSVVESLLENHAAPFVTTYLHMFQLQSPGGWPELAALLKEDGRLRLEDAQATPGEPEVPQPREGREAAVSSGEEAAPAGEAEGEQEFQQAERTVDLAEEAGFESSSGIAEATPSSEEK